MLDKQKEKLLFKKSIQNFLEKEYQSTNNVNDIFFEIFCSTAHYLKSFTNIKKLLDYICLVFKYTFQKKLLVIVPLNDQGEIWHDYISISANIEKLQIQEQISQFIDKFHFSKNFKIKEIANFENALKTNFKDVNPETLRDIKLELESSTAIYLETAVDEIKETVENSNAFCFGTTRYLQ